MKLFINAQKIPRISRYWRVGILAVLVAVELAFLSESPPHDFIYSCWAAVPAALCQLFSLAIERAIFFLGTCLIFALAQLSIPRLLLEDNGNRDSKTLHWSLAVHSAGFGLILLPWTFTGIGATREALLVAFGLWALGGLMATLGALLLLASPRQWKMVATELGAVRLCILAGTFFAPEIVRSTHAIWFIEPLTRATFILVVAMLDFFNMQATANPETFVLASPSFRVEISWMCSGVEGFALITLFLLCYFYAFSADLRFPQVWVLIPISLLLSWLLNIVRITVLFAIGSRYSPQLAVNGFHSHAGWLMFSLLSFSIIGISRTVPWFHKSPVAESAPLSIRKDWDAARILPFAAFMGASLLLSTFFPMPDLWYVMKVVAMTATLAIFLPHYRKLSWKLDWLALAAGLAIGVLWIALSAGHSVADSPINSALAGLPPIALAAWIVLRICGTVLLVPMVEELFFRGYVLERLDQGSLKMRLLALAVSSGLFAVLHERWALAGLAGLVYGLLYLRRRQITDAVSSHAVSNAFIAAVALASNDWSLI